jgi:hypothetical protein
MRLVLVGSCALLAACGKQEPPEAEASAATVRQVVSAMLARPNFKMPAGKCMCPGFEQDGVVEDFPPGLLDDIYARNPWLRRWSDCAEFNGQLLTSSACPAGATKFVCGAVDQPSVAQGVQRVECRAYNDPLDGYVMGWDVSRTDSGKLVAKPTGLDWIE